ncbi:acyltransferase [Saccharicrinis sp. 156]|uniref:acyltransferase n=1 Tax=Saccharicrinis sp. 156 TaxID=3417574 RepID=UPI003D339DB6
MVLIKLISYWLKRLARHVYWLLNLSKIKGIGTATIAFPIIVEGKGTIELGFYTQLKKHAKLLIAQSAQFLVGERAIFDSNTDIRIGKGGKLKIGHNFSIEYGSRIFTAKEWLFGNDVKIATHCAIFSRESVQGILTIGEGTHIGDNTILDITDNLSIGEEVAIGPNCTIYTHDHDYKQTNKAAWKGGIVKKPVVIEDGAWIGSGVTILPGISIGKNAVVAAGSVITKDVPELTIWGGVPAKQIKTIQ